MLIKHIVIVALAIFLLTTSVGCEEKRPVQESKSEASTLTCADIDKVTDPVKRQELSNRCVREGEFKPSTGKKW